VVTEVTIVFSTSPFLELMSFEALSKAPYLASDTSLLAVN